jgi:PIN domain nuclease of toxin-antitoxin system
MIDERDRLTDDVRTIVDDYDNLLYISLETVKELVVAHRRKNLLAHKWKTAEELVEAIKTDYNVTILNVDINVIQKMAQLQINEAEQHYDPSDHIIIAHAMTVGMTLISSDRKFPFYRAQGLDLVSNF